MYGCFKVDVPDVKVAEKTIKYAGRSFLASARGALESLSELSAMQGFRGIHRSRVFAYDGQQAAILVIEGQTTTFCNEISEGLYDLR